MEEFVVNKMMLLTGCVLIPVIAWFVKFNVSFRTKIVGWFFILLFSKGFLEILDIPNAFSGLLCELLLVFMLISFRKTKRRHYPGLFFIGGIIFTAIVSALMNGTDVIQFFLFFREYFEVIVLFYLVLNIQIMNSYNLQMF